MQISFSSLCVIRDTRVTTLSKISEEHSTALRVVAVPGALLVPPRGGCEPILRLHSKEVNCVAAMHRKSSKVETSKPKPR